MHGYSICEGVALEKKTKQLKKVIYTSSTLKDKIAFFIIIVTLHMCH